MLVSLLVATALAATPGSQAAPQEPVASGDPVALEDVVVTGRSLDALVRDFVGEVAAPNRHRGLARWNGEVCVGVANLKAETAQYLADRVSTVASDIGLSTGDPGCKPNILIVATDDGESLAKGLVDESPRAFRMGGSGMDRGGAALRDFQAGDKPVRWWQMALPVNADTGERAVRIPGDCTGQCDGAMSYAPVTNVFAASRLNTSVVDNLIRAIVIVDLDEISDVSVLQLADYIAMVSLAQIDPEADTAAYSSILNVFSDPAVAPSLTNWDKAYLEGLYRSEQGHRMLRAGQTEVRGAILRAHERLRADETAED